MFIVFAAETEADLVLSALNLLMSIPALFKNLF